MKSNVKRFLALMTAATMLAAPCTAYGSATSNSTGSLEFDNSIAPEVGSVILPTINDSTFDFIIDPEDKLNEYRPETFTSTGSGIYFQSVATKGAIVAAANTEAAISIYVKTGASISDVKAAFTLSDGAIEPVASPAGIYYVWTPVSVASGGAGQYVKIDKTNLDTYFKWDTTQTTGAITGLAFKNRIENATTDGKVYTNAPVASTPGAYDPADYVTVDTAGAITEILPDVIITSGSAITDELTKNQLELTDSTKAWTDTSDSLRVINRSTKAYTITAEVTVDVQSGSGLVYLNSAAAISASTDAAIHFDIASKPSTATAQAITAVEKDDTGIKGTVSVNLAAAGGDAIHYISKAFDSVGANTPTGGDVFKQYVPASLAPEDVTFQIQASVSTGDDTHDAWKDYADKLTAGETTRPTIQVVYSFEETEETDDESDSVIEYSLTSSITWSGKTFATLNGPEGVTSTNMTQAWLVVDDNEEVEVASTSYGANASGSGISVWVNTAGTTGDHIAFKFVIDSTTYQVQLW